MTLPHQLRIDLALMSDEELSVAQAACRGAWRAAQERDDSNEKLRLFDQLMAILEEQDKRDGIPF